MKIRNAMTLEIMDTHVRCLRGKTQADSVVVTDLKMYPLQSSDDQEIIRVLKQQVRKDYKKKVVPIIFVLPRRWVLLKHMRLPSHEEQEVRKMVGLQLGRQIPYALEEVVFDCHSLEQEDSGYTRVLVVIAHKNILMRFFGIFQDAGLHIDQVTMASLGVLSWGQYCGEKPPLVSAMMLVDVGASYTDICFCMQGRLLFSRSLDIGVKAFKQNAAESFFKELNLSIRTYQKERWGPTIAGLQIFSSWDSMEALAQRYQFEIPLPIVVDNVFAHISCSRKFNKNVFEQYPDMSLTAAVGVLLAPSAMQINLKPAEVDARKKKRAQKRQGVRALVLTGVLCVLISGYVVLMGQRQQQVLAQVQTEFKVTQKAVKQLRQRREFIDAIRQEQTSQWFVPDVMAELYRITPKDISFHFLRLDKKKSLSIQGYAFNRNDVNDFQAQLVQSSLFNEVTLKFTTQRKIFQQDLVEFKFIVILAPQVSADISKETL